jgi:argininosuccinate lyase
MSKIWTGRISKSTDKAVEEFTSSICVDKKLYLYDIVGTAAHVIGLNKIGILSDDESKKIIAGLEEVKKKIELKEVKDIDNYEDIHSLVENELAIAIGKTAEKIHTGRSRNDQVALDEKLFLKDALSGIVSKIIFLQKNLIELADKEINLAMPAYTHLQKAQPVLLSHYLLSFFEKFKRDINKFYEVFELNDCLPLGAAACTGSGYRVDRKFLKETLKFKYSDSNSMDIVASRDSLLDFIYCCSLVMVHLSRFCEDLIIYSSSEFSYINIDETFCTGSSIMPQKKNPDILELIRGKSSIIIGNLMQIMVLIKGLPTTYNRDLQEDKKILFNAYEETYNSIEIFSKLLKKIKFNPNVIENSLKEGFLEATDIADYLVKKGESFRKSHNIVGRIVKYCIENDMQLKDLTLKELNKYSPYFGKDFYEKIELKSCINSKDVDCGTNKKQVIAKIESAKSVIKDWENKLEELCSRIPDFEELVRYNTVLK